MLTKGEIAKLEPGKHYGFGYGLHLFVTPTRKVWRQDIRFGGRPLLLTLGPWPAVSAEEALAASLRVKADLKEGRDPRGAKAVQGPPPLTLGDTFGEFADVYIGRLEGKQAQGRRGGAPATIAKAEWILGTPPNKKQSLFEKKEQPGLVASLRSRPVKSITSGDCSRVLRAIERQGKLETARRTKILMSEVFRLAIEADEVEHDPTVAVKLDAPEVKNHPAIVSPKKFGMLLKSIDAYSGGRVVRSALQLIALNPLRPGELRHATWADINLTKAIWTVPAGIMKTRKEHVIPLAPQSIAILERMQRRDKSARVFPGIRNPKDPISENAMNVALKAMGFDDHVSHGFRSTFSTLANESGKWSSEAIERQLAHKDTDAVRTIYDRSKHWPERVKLTAWWAEECDRMRARTLW